MFHRFEKEGKEAQFRKSGGERINHFGLLTITNQKPHVQHVDYARGNLIEERGYMIMIPIKLGHEDFKERVRVVDYLRNSGYSKYYCYLIV